MSQLDIPFNRSSLLGRELEYIFHTMTIGQIAGDQTYPVTEDVSDRLLRLPFFCALTDADQMRIIEAVLQFEP